MIRAAQGKMRNARRGPCMPIAVPFIVSPMMLPYVVSTLLYVFDSRDRVLLLNRMKKPNKGLWSPCGGKLDMASGESPYDCACREGREEMGMNLKVSDLRLVGLISETGYESEAHWLMFLFEIKPRLDQVPPPISEGYFQFFKPEELKDLPMPRTDREFIWPQFWRSRGGFFSAHCQCMDQGQYQWTVEETR